MALSGALCLGASAAAGAKMAYVCQSGQICLANDDGTAAETLTNAGTPLAGNRALLSADGGRIAVSSLNSTYVYFVDSKLRKGVAPGETSDLAFSPDATTVATIERVGSEGETSVICQYSVAVGLGSRSCTGPDQGEPVVGRIAYGPDNRLYMTAFGASGLELCRHASSGAGCDDVVVPSLPAYVDSFAISPDGTRVAVVGSSNLSPSGSVSIYDMTTGQLVRQLTTNGFDAQPAWTQDGKNVAFTRREFSPSAVYIISAEGKPGDEKQLLGTASSATFGGPPTGPLTPVVQAPPPGQAATPGTSAVLLETGLKVPIVPLLSASVRASQKGTIVTGTVRVGAAGSTLKVTLKGGYGSVTKRRVAAGKVSFRVKLNAKGRKALRAHRELKLKLVITVTTAAGKSATKTRAVTLRR